MRSLFQAVCEMTKPMLYLARKLHLPLSDVLERQVVVVRDGVVLEWYPFGAECESMLLVDDLYVDKDSDGALRVEKCIF